ncbi:MAG TPA: [FeFe] hydrogenase H-cluster radical SAM maturase HydE [Bacillota bacterium]|jgi:biotin synthase
MGSDLDRPVSASRPTFARALERALAGDRLGHDEIVALLEARGAEVDQLRQAADAVRRRHLGDDVHLRGVIEFSNHCRCNCLYCGLRAGHKDLERYRISPEEMVEIAGRAAGLGYRTIVLQSGEDVTYDADTIAWVVRRIKDHLDVAVTVAVGDRPRQEYQAWRRAGADRYLLKHETADPELFARLRPGTVLADRIQHLRWLKELGYQVGSGNMIGLPGQTVETIAADLLLLRELDVEMAGIGPFIPNGETPLADCPGGTLEQTLIALGVARLVLPLTHLPATTATGSIDPQGRQKALGFGANVIMPNVTPGRYREDYRIYPNKICLAEEPENCRPCVEAIITSLGRTVAQDQGHSPKDDFVRSGR